MRFRVIYLVLFVLIFTGCGLLSESAKIMYEDSHSIQTGQVIENPLGLYRVTVPDNYLFVEHNKYNLELQRKGSIVFRKYSVFVQPVNKLPDDIVDNLDGSFEWVKTKFDRKVRQKIIVITKESREFLGNDAIYFEFFIPPKWHQGFGGITVVDNMPYGYCNILFYENGHLFWLYYGAEIKASNDNYRKDVVPHIPDEIFYKFQNFLDGFAI